LTTSLRHPGVIQSVVAVTTRMHEAVAVYCTTTPSSTASTLPTGSPVLGTWTCCHDPVPSSGATYNVVVLDVVPHSA
jgi:hypothetical protein